MNHHPYGTFRLDAMNLQVSPYCDDVPRMMPDPAFAALMPEEFIAELRDWMIKFFGTEDKIYAIDNGRTIICGPKTVRKLREVTA